MKNPNCILNLIGVDNTTHGKSNTKFYRVWASIKSRCDLPSWKKYKNYGGRGITYCERWKTFQNFYDDMFPSYSPGLTIDRINNDGNYEPSNCRWITIKEQSHNKSNSIYLIVNNETKSLLDWCKIYGKHPASVIYRIRKLGWDAKRSLETKPGRGFAFKYIK